MMGHAHRNVFNLVRYVSPTFLILEDRIQYGEGGQCPSNMAATLYSYPCPTDKV